MVIVRADSKRTARVILLLMHVHVDVVKVEDIIIIWTVLLISKSSVVKESTGRDRE
jgi:hypothetical protein